MNQHKKGKSEEFDSPSKEEKSKFENSKSAENRQFKTQNSKLKIQKQGSVS